MTCATHTFHSARPSTASREQPGDGLSVGWLQPIKQQLRLPTEVFHLLPPIHGEVRRKMLTRGYALGGPWVLSYS